MAPVPAFATGGYVRPDVLSWSDDSFRSAMTPTCTHITTPRNEGARQVADYKVTVTTDANDEQHVCVEVTGSDLPSSKIAEAVAKATQAGLSAKTPPAIVNINVDGSVLSGNDLARAIQEAAQRFPRVGGTPA